MQLLYQNGLVSPTEIYKIGVCVMFGLLLCLCVMYVMFELCCEVQNWGLCNICATFVLVCYVLNV